MRPLCEQVNRLPPPPQVKLGENVLDGETRTFRLADSFLSAYYKRQY